VTDRIRTGAETLARSRAEPLTLRSHGAFGAIRTRGLLRTEETLYPLELRRHELGKRDSDAHLKTSKACGIPVTPFPIGAACRSRTRCLGGTNSALSPDELTRHGYARRELNPHQLGPRPSPSSCCGTSAWSLWTASNRLPSPYEGDALPDELQRHGYRGWNRTSVPLGQSQGGMPATHPVMVRKVRFERTGREVWAREVCHFPSLPHGAPPGTRTPTETQVKSLPLYH
jgi:hypothetical protein